MEVIFTKDVINQARAGEVKRVADMFLEGREVVGGFAFVSGEAELADRDSLRQLTELVRGRLDEPWVVLLAASFQGKPAFVAAASVQAVEAGVHAVQLFDSWVGALSSDDYREFLLPHSQKILKTI